jgi:uncharacterized membrane protein YeaQ/YmgE (transglycosylase-associated protein family)
VSFYDRGVINKKEKLPMLIDILLWIVFGALAGWIASMIMGTDGQMGAGSNIIVGIVGAFIGGFVVRFLTGIDAEGFNITSLIVAVIGAVILLAIMKALGGRNATV